MIVNPLFNLSPRTTLNIRGILFNNSIRTDYLVEDMGVDSTGINLTHRAREIFTKHRNMFKYKQPKARGSGLNRTVEWEGPRLGKGLWTRYYQTTTGYYNKYHNRYFYKHYESLYIRISPDHLLGLDRYLARGGMLIDALKVAAEVLTGWFGRVTVADLLLARLSYLELAWDISQFPYNGLSDLPLAYQGVYWQNDFSGPAPDSCKTIQFVHGSKRITASGKTPNYYVRLLTDSTAFVIYKKEDGGEVLRLEFRFQTRESVKKFLGVEAGRQNLYTFLLGEGLVAKLMGKLKYTAKIDTDTEIVSRGYIVSLINEFKPRNRLRLIRGLTPRYLAEEVTEFKEEAEYVRRYLKNRKSNVFKRAYVVGTYEDGELRILLLAENMCRAAEVMVSENKAAIENYLLEQSQHHNHTNQKNPRVPAQFIYSG